MRIVTMRIVIESMILFAEGMFLSWLLTEVHEQLHLCLSKGFTLRSRINAYSFLDGFMTDLPWWRRVVAIFAPSVWNYAFGSTLLAIAWRIYPYTKTSHDFLILGTGNILLYLPWFFIGSGIANVFPMTPDGLALWTLIIGRIYVNPFPDFFTNRFEESTLAKLLGYLGVIIWSMALYILSHVHRMWILLIGIIISFIISIIVLLVYSNKQEKLKIIH